MKGACLGKSGLARLSSRKRLRVKLAWLGLRIIRHICAYNVWRLGVVAAPASRALEVYRLEEFGEAYIFCYSNILEEGEMRLAYRATAGMAVDDRLPLLAQTAPLMIAISATKAIICGINLRYHCDSGAAGAG